LPSLFALHSVTLLFSFFSFPLLIDASDILSAVSNNNLKLLKSYLKKDFNVNKLYKQNLFGENFTWSLLHAASYYGAIDCVNALMAHSADIELQDTWYGGRALAWAAFGGHIDLCSLLVKKWGADPLARNKENQTAYDLVSDPENKEWAGILYNVEVKLYFIFSLNKLEIERE